MPTAYSYVRFSTPEQSKGDSIRRQIELSRKYADDNSLTLDESLQLNDLGVSAFKGDNAATGKLGLFISAIESGRIKSGSYLLIESLDRLSRSEVISALNLFTKILSYDIIIVTLTDNRVYTRESINDIGNLMYSLLVMSRAHEESLMKSKRVSAAWDNKRRKARDGSRKMTKTCPSWLTLENDEFNLVPERVALVQRMYQMSLNGIGYALIAKQFNEEKQSVFEAFGKKANGWYPSYIARILKNPAVFGQMTPHTRVNGKRVAEEPIENYYPVIVSRDDFFAVQAAISSRRGKGGEVGKNVNIFANLLKCGKCGNSAIKVNKSGKQASIDKYYKWVVIACDSGRRGVTACGWHPWKLDELEKALINEIKELDISLILDNKAKDQSLSILKQNIDSVGVRISSIQSQKNRLIDAIANGDAGLEAITDRIRLLSQEEVDLIETKELLEEEYQTESHRISAMTSSVDEIKRLSDKLDDKDIRFKLQTEVRRLVDKIVLHFEINKFVIHYHTPKMIVRFKDSKSINKSVSFIESDADYLDDPAAQLSFAGD